MFSPYAVQRLAEIPLDTHDHDRAALAKPMLEIESFSKCFGKRTAANAISLQVGRHERLAILGPSGAGKSTLLRMIAGLERPDSGELRIDGVSAKSLAPDRRGLAYMSQDYPLYPQLTVRRNLETALLSLKLTKPLREARCRETLNWFGIEGLAERLPSELSGGQAQRVALAKALIRRPACLLLDEPLSQLDSALRDELRRLLVSICDHFEICLVFVTHNPLDVFELAHRLAILIDGRLVQSGTASDVYHSPACRPAAELLSPWGINWIGSQDLDSSEATWRPLSEASKTAVRDSGEGALDSSPQNPSKWLDRVRADVSQGLSVGFRPENSHLLPASALGKLLADQQKSRADDYLAMAVIIEHVQSVGFAQMAYVRAGRQRYRCLLPNTAIVPHNLNSDPKTDALQLVIDASALLHCRSH